MTKHYTESDFQALGEVPNDLGGFQLVCGGRIELGDLLVWTRAGAQAFKWAECAIGFRVSRRGRIIGNPSNARVYRRIPVVKTEGWSTPKSGDVHHSNPEPRKSEGFVLGSVEINAGQVVYVKDGALPHDAAARKNTPIATGVIDYFPDAIAEIARVSKAGNDQHHPGKALHWDKSKSTDEADALMRHLIDRGTRDADGQRHSAKVAWRALALLQREIEAERKAAK